MNFNPSEQQHNFFKWVVEDEGSCVLEAVAGSGKTTTLIHALNLMKGEIFFGAYNKKIQLEIATKVGNKSNVTVSTMHAAGLGAWKKHAPKLVVDSNKCRTIYRNTFADSEFFNIEGATLALVSYAKQAAVGVTSQIQDVNVWYSLIDHFNVDTLGKDETVIDCAKQVLMTSIAQDTKVIDFDDMIYAPLIHGVKATEYDWVLIDEAQDTNASRRALALLMLKRGGRLVAVGDRHQAIYGFTGADADSLDQIAKAVNAIQMPLTVTYRCPKNVVAEATKYVNHITAHETAIDGEVINFKEDLVKSAKVNDAILCRFNAPLINLVFRFIAEGIPAKVEGREIGTSIKTLVKRYKSKTFSVLIERLDGYKERECAKLRMKEKESQAVAIEDKVNCIKVIIERIQKIDPKCSTPVERVCQEVDAIFEDGVNKAVILSTIHKSKGREFDRVFWLQTGKSKWARMDWELEQEKNLCYVAITRAKQTLYIVSQNKDKHK